MTRISTDEAIRRCVSVALRYLEQSGGEWRKSNRKKAIARLRREGKE